MADAAQRLAVVAGRFLSVPGGMSEVSLISMTIIPFIQ